MVNNIDNNTINNNPKTTLAENEQLSSANNSTPLNSGHSLQESTPHVFDQVKEITIQEISGNSHEGYAPVEFSYSSYESDSAVQASTHVSLDFVGHGDDRLHESLSHDQNPNLSPSHSAINSFNENLYHSNGEIFLTGDHDNNYSPLTAHQGHSNLLTDPHAENLAEGTVDINHFTSTSSTDQLIGGSGEDSFVFDNTHSLQNTSYDNLAIFDSTVDLGGINPVSVETINIETALDNYLNISAQDVQNMSSEGHIVVDGSANDIINLQGEWVRGDSVDGYTQYTSGESSISVDDTIVNAGHVNIV